MRLTVLHQCMGLLFMVALLFFAVPVDAQEPRRLTLEPSQAPYNLAGFSDFLMEHEKSAADWDARLQLPELIALDDETFDPVISRQIGFGLQGSIVHIRTRIENPTQVPQDWLLSFNQTKWGHRAVYLALDDEPIPTEPIFVYSEDVPWRVSDRLVHTTFTLPPLSTGTLYVSYENTASSAPMTIENPQDYQQRRLIDDLTIYVLLGLVLGVTVLTISLIGVLHQHVAIYYAGYVVCATIHICYVFDLFHPSPLLSLIASPFASFFIWGAASGSLYLLFQYAFFANIPNIRTGYRNVILGIASINLILLLAHGVLGMPLSYSLAGASIGMLLLPVNGIVAVVKKITGRWFFAVGCLSLTVMTTPLFLSDPLTAHYTYEEAAMIFLYGLAIEAVTLSGAMFAKIRKISAEREKALMSELELTRDKLNTTRRMAAAAHDIQQPLLSLRMALSDKHPHLEQRSEIDHAIDYLDDIVRTQMAEAKSDLSHHDETEHTSPDEFDAALILNNLQSMFAEEAQAKGLSLHVAPTTLRVTTNALGLMRILSNVVSNAIRNTHSGGILIGCRPRSTFVRFDIYDTGVGLDSDALAELEKPYQRRGDYEGQGLGLSIVRQLCEDHNLTFEFSSPTNRGTTFHVFVPKAGE